MALDRSAIWASPSRACKQAALAGYCAGRDGHTDAFAVLVRCQRPAVAQRAQDRVARPLAAPR